jgi:chlorite dismutase
MVYVSFTSENLAVPEGTRVNKYAVKQGAGPFPTGSTVYRLESEAPIDSGLRGVVQHLQYTTFDERTDLVKRSRTELPPSPDMTAVLSPIRKSEEWWAMAHDQRGEHFHKKHTPIGAPYVETIFRKLYHSRYLGSSYDFLTYFEFPNDAADTFRKLLRELRETEEWKYVSEEYEVWMTKLA